MDHLSRVCRVAAAGILCALVLRISGGFEKITAFLSQPNISAFLIYLETGRDVRFSPSLAVFSPHFAESPPAAIPKREPEPEPALPFYSGSTRIWNQSGVKTDPEALLEAPLEWNLTDGEPAVLILHTHTTESYTKKDEPYVEVSAWRTLDEGYNMRSIGAEVGRLLTESGITVALEGTVHDYPGYNGSYVRARKTIRKALEQYPDLRLVLDLHRDASGDESGQLRTLAEKDGETSAQIMLVVGTNHEKYEENLSLALKLHAQLEKQFPGITRPLQLRGQRFNQDLHPGALLIEVGAAGNSHAEALTAARELAKAIVAIRKGTASPQ